MYIVCTFVCMLFWYIMCVCNKQHYLMFTGKTEQPLHDPVGQQCGSQTLYIARLPTAIPPRA